MKSQASDRPRGVWAITLIAFLTAFVATHLPPPSLPTTAAMNDKLLHAFTYLVLGMLTRACLSRPRTRHARSDQTISLLSLALYALFDEATQPIVGRTFEIGDLLADGLGATVGVLVMDKFLVKRQS